jgi:hypothetical protein
VEPATGVRDPHAGATVELFLQSPAAAQEPPNAPGRYTALVGTSSTELDHAASFEVGHPGRRR